MPVRSTADATAAASVVVRDRAPSARRACPLLVALALALHVAWSGQAQAQMQLVFGTYSSDKPSAMVEQIRPALDRVAESLGEALGQRVEIRMQVMKDYKEGVALIVAGHADIARLGPASYVKAKSESPDLDILAMESQGGATTFNGVICVRADSAITDVAQLRGKAFAFGAEDSTLGRYFAQLRLARSGVRAHDLGRYEYLGRHDKVGMSVGTGLFDAGSLEETTFDKLVKNGVPIRAILKYPNATRPWVARAGLEPRLKRLLSQALLTLSDPKALAALRFDGFLAGDDSDYEPTRQAINENSLFFAEAK
jgi:phosphonate transport system substrate-binding protein